MKNLFLTGNVGCGKSTSIAAALGEHLLQAGGFLTVRQRDDAGHVSAFWLKRPDGSDGKIIIQCGHKPYSMHPEVFETFGLQLLEEALQADFVVLDEIGGFEVLSESFLNGLIRLLKSDVPCIGVIKGEGPGNKMLQKLDLADAYAQKAEGLRNWMRMDENTLLYACGQYDPEGLRLAESWARTYLPGK